MNKQIIILFFLLLVTGVTIFLYIWKTKKEIYYKNDERWLEIQNKANNTTNYLNYIFILLLAIGEVVTLFSDVQITFTFNNILTYGILLLGLRNIIELLALRYFDNQM